MWQFRKSSTLRVHRSSTPFSHTFLYISHSGCWFVPFVINTQFSEWLVFWVLWATWMNQSRPRKGSWELLIIASLSEVQVTIRLVILISQKIFNRLEFLSTLYYIYTHIVCFLSVIIHNYLSLICAFSYFADEGNENEVKAICSYNIA